MKWNQLAGMLCLSLAVFSSQPAWGQMGKARDVSAFTPRFSLPDEDEEPRPPRVPRPPMVTTDTPGGSAGKVVVSAPSRSIVSVQSVGKNRSVPFEVIRGSGAPNLSPVPQANRAAQKTLAEVALKALNAAQSIEELTPFLDHPHPQAQAQAIELLLDHGPQGRSVLVTAAQSSKVRARIAALWGLGMNDPTNSEIELIVEAMRDQNDSVQRVAIQAAGRLGAEAAAMTQAALMEALESDNADIRTAASSAIVRLAPEVVPDLVRLLGARREVVRDAAGRTLIKIGEPAVAPLIEQLKDPRPTVRYWAVYSLGEIGTPAVEALPLLESMAHSDPDSTVKFYAQIAAQRLKR